MRLDGQMLEDFKIVGTQVHYRGEPFAGIAGYIHQGVPIPIDRVGPPPAHLEKDIIAGAMDSIARNTIMETITAITTLRREMKGHEAILAWIQHLRFSSMSFYGEDEESKAAQNLHRMFGEIAGHVRDFIKVVEPIIDERLHLFEEEQRGQEKG